MSLAMYFWAEDRLPSPCPHIFVVGVWYLLLQRKEKHSVALYRLEVGGGTWPACLGLFSSSAHLDPIMQWLQEREVPCFSLLDISLYPHHSDLFP